MGISFGYGQPIAKEDGIKLIRAAVDHGVTFFDTAEAYGPYTNEELLGEALTGVRDKVVIATKFGFSYKDGKQEPGVLNSQQDRIREMVIKQTLKRVSI